MESMAKQPPAGKSDGPLLRIAGVLLCGLGAGLPIVGCLALVVAVLDAQRANRRGLHVGNDNVRSATSELVVYIALGLICAIAGWYLRRSRQPTSRLARITGLLTSRRFTFAFTLRTVLVMTLLLGVWCGWQYHIVCERKAVLAEIRRVDAANPVYGKLSADPSPAVPDDGQIGAIRRAMGDEACPLLNIPQSLTPEWIARAERAFPEADLVIRDDITNRVRASRSSLYKPPAEQLPNTGAIFTTGAAGT